MPPKVNLEHYRLFKESPDSKTQNKSIASPELLQDDEPLAMVSFA
jgi:hypothetical protein